MKKQITRNITPNFIRFKKSPLPRQNLERSNSKKSNGSFHQYQNIIIQNSKYSKSPINTELPVQCNIKSQKILNLVRHNRLVKNDQSDMSHRSGSNNQEKVKPDMRVTNSFRQRDLPSVKRKLISSSKSLNKHKSPKVTIHMQQDKPDYEQIKAVKQKAEILKNLMKAQRPNPLMKLRIRREDLKKKPTEQKTNRKFFGDSNISLNGVSNLKKYEIYGELGKGAYGTVRMAYDKINDMKVALKIYEKCNLDEPSKLSNVERQILIQFKINHPTITKIFEAIEGPEEIIIVQEYGGANSLYRYLLSRPGHRLQQTETKNFFKLIVQAVQYLHKEGIVHRDIKAENLLINRQHKLKLIDFGFSLFTAPPQTIDTFCGTPTYMAPQIVSKLDHVSRYTDVWSLGVLLYVLLQGNYPFRARSQEQLFETIKRGQLSFIHDDITPGSKEMIRRFIVVDPLKRPVLSDLLSSSEWKDWLNC